MAVNIKLAHVYLMHFSVANSSGNDNEIVLNIDAEILLIMYALTMYFAIDKTICLFKIDSLYFRS